MNKKTKQWLKEEDEKAKSFKLTGRDLHYLHDILYMVNWQDYGTIKLNKMDKWFEKFFDRVEEFCIPELYDQKKSET